MIKLFDFGFMTRLWKHLKLHEKCLVLAYVVLALLVDFHVYVVSGMKEARVDYLLYAFGWIFALLSFRQSIIDFEYEEENRSSHE